ncbi:4171_t:CDS:2, partial [Funneliformis geosporum]
MTTITTIHDLQSREQGEFAENVLRLQSEAESEFEQKAEKIKEEIKDLNEDEIEQHVHNTFYNLNTLFLKKSKELEDYVIKQKPKKPIKIPKEKDEEYEKKCEDYKKHLNSYKTFVYWGMSIIGRLANWLSELFNDIINFFKNLWNWIKSMAQDIATKVRNFVVMVKEKFIYSSLLKQNVDIKVIHDLESMLESHPDITKAHRDERKYILGPNGGKIGIACQETLVTFGSTEMTTEILSSEMGVSKENYKKMIGDELTAELKETRPELIILRLWVMGNKNSSGNKLNINIPEKVQINSHEEELLNRNLASDVDYIAENYSYHFIKSHLFQSDFSSPIKERLVQGGDKVLDVACGAGTWLLDLSTKYENSHFYGLDYQAIYPQEIKPPNLNFIKADILDGLPFPDNEFDFVHQDTLVYDLQRNQWDFVLSELIRITKPGGYIEITDIYCSESSFGPILY